MNQTAHMQQYSKSRSDATKVVMLVANTVTHDARVLKEARSLRQRGYDVSLVGVMDNNINTSAVLMSDGLPIYRVDWKSYSYELSEKFLKRVLVLFTLAIFALVLGLGYLFRQSGSSGGFQEFISVQNLIAIVLNLSLLGLLLAPLLLLGYFALKRVRELRENYRIVPTKKKAPIEYPRLVQRLRLKPFYALIWNFLADTQARSTYLAREQKLAEAAIAMNPDIIHCHDVHTLPAGAAVKKATAAKLVYDAHELYEHIPQATQEQINRYTSYHERYHGIVDAFVTVNDSFARIYEETYPGFANGVVVRNATIMSPDHEYDGRLHDAAELPLDRKILLFQGGFAPRRGILTLMNAAPHLPDDWSIVFMGWGNLESQMHECVKKLARQSRKDLEEKITDKDVPGFGAILEKNFAELNEYYLSLARQEMLGKTHQKTTSEHVELRSDVEEDTGDSSEVSKSEENKPLNPNPENVDRVVELEKLMPDSDIRRHYQTRMKFLKAEADMQELAASNYLSLYERRRQAIERFERRAAFLGLQNSHNYGASIDQSYDKVRIIPPVPQDELVAWTAGGTIGVIPYENFGLNHWYCNPNKLWEFPNANIPLLVSPFPELMAQVTKYNIGWVLPPDFTSEQLGRFVAKLSDEDIREKREATRAYKQVENWSAYEQRLIDLYDGLTGHSH